MTTDEMPCVISQVFDLCRDQGLGKPGVDLFAYDLPNEDSVKYPTSVTIMDIGKSGDRLGLLNGTTRMHREGIVLVSRHSDAEEAKKKLVPFVTMLKNSSGNTVMQGVRFASITPLMPIHLGGTDKNGKWVAEIAFAILRNPL